MAYTGFKVQGADLGDMYLTYADLAQYYPQMVGGAKASSATAAGVMNGSTFSGNAPNANSIINSTANPQIDRVFAGENVGAYIKTDGSLWMWGTNASGRIGDGTSTSKSSPVQVFGGQKWLSVAMAKDSTVAIRADRTLWGWGGYSWFLPGNALSFHSSPVQILAGSTGWKEVEVDNTNGVAAAIKTDGTLWTWGADSFGGLGHNTLASSSSPAQIFGGGTNWKNVTVRFGGGTAIKTDGTLWSWGYNSAGELGDNTTVQKSSPVQTIAGGTNWKQVVTPGQEINGGMVLALKTDGTLWTWGGRFGATASFSSPVQILSNNRWAEVFGSGAPINGFAAARSVDGNIWRWKALGTGTSTTPSPSIVSPRIGYRWMQFAVVGGDAEGGYLGTHDTTLSS